MRHGSAVMLEPTSARILPARNPDGDFATIYVDTHDGQASGRLTIVQIGNLTEGRLSTAPDGALVLVAGTIESVRVFDRTTPAPAPAAKGEESFPTAAVRLGSGTGADAIVQVSPLHYEQTFGYLVMGRTVGIAGRVRRTSTDAPPVVDLVRVFLTASDVLTTEAYRARAELAVAL